MPSRLDRLFTLLESGGSSATRNAAAEQLGEIVKHHPNDAGPLIARLHSYLISKSWDTRVSAGQAVSAIVRNLDSWCPEPNIKEECSSSQTFGGPERFSLKSFNIRRVLEKGSYLSSSSESNFETNTEGMETEDHAGRQKDLVNEALGLNKNLGLSLDFVSNADFLNENQTTNNEQEGVNSIVEREIDAARANLSSREINRAKRKRKSAISRQFSAMELKGQDTSYGSEPKRMKLKNEYDSDDNEMLTISEDNKEVWPFHNLCEQLTGDLFDSCWETRHGAATAFRDVIKMQGLCAGKTPSQTLQQMEESNQQWLEDKAVRFVCVLALDRFGDFIEDQVVAPVRETCAQALGAVVQFLKEETVYEIMKLLLEMLQWEDWPTRHGGLLGLKYLIAVRQDLTPYILSQSYDSIYKGLKDEVDDVVAVAAMCLVPVANQLATLMTYDKMDELLCTLWDSLLELDDLTASTSSILALLSKLLSCPQMLSSTLKNVNQWTPRLYRFLYHSNSGTRAATLKVFVNLTKSSDCDLSPILSSLLIQIFQRSVLETDSQNLLYILEIWTNTVRNVPLSSLLYVACPLASSWLYLLGANQHLPLDPNVIVVPEQKIGDKWKKNASSTEANDTIKLYLGGGTMGANEAEITFNTTRARCYGAKLLGLLSVYLVKPMPGVESNSEEPLLCYLRLLLTNLVSPSYLPRVAAGFVIREWASIPPGVVCHESLQKSLYDALAMKGYYEEMAWSLAKMQQDAKDFIVLMTHYRVVVDSKYQNQTILSTELLESLTGPATEQTILSTKCRKKVQEMLCNRRKTLQTSISATIAEHTRLNNKVLAVLSGAVVRLKCLPEKLNPVVRPLIEAIRKESDPILQEMASDDLVCMVSQCIGRESNTKIIKNLSVFLCVDPLYTPNVSANPVKFGISSLNISEDPKKLENSNVPRGPGRPKATNDNELSAEEIKQRKSNYIQRTGVTMALQKICLHFGPELFMKLPNFKSLIFDHHLSRSDLSSTSLEDAQKAINWLQFLEVVIPSLDGTILDQLNEQIHPLSQYCYHPYTSVRYMAARALSALASKRPIEIMTFCLTHMMPQLDINPVSYIKEGTMEFLHLCIEKLGLDIIPYIVLFMIPLLGRMSDHLKTVRSVAMQCFASLVRLYPLGYDCKPIPQLPQELLLRMEREKEFLEMLIDPTKIENYVVPVPISAELRSYQQNGVNWLSFLNRYGLHGILCDDMGLGKTLQSICILAGDHFTKEQESTPHISSSTGVQSLVICPPTLTGHWYYEINKFVSKKYLDPLHYTGSPIERKRLRDDFHNHNVIIASYKIIRNEIDYFSTKKWNYIILDEGHVIKNVRTKSAKAIKELNGMHRIILTGTPIQNNVTELWALFDFLMPGFLGSERSFQIKFSKPILQSRDPKCSSKDQEAGVVAIEKLHRQTLPFILRRMKHQVLKDLPPKITQDYYCDLSPLQETLYEDFAKSQNCNLGLGDDISDQTHVFQALQYLRRVCNHPRLVLKPSHPKYEEIIADLRKKNSSLTDISQSAKLLALRQLLIDCGIGECDDLSEPNIQSVVSPHRALVFCQFKSMLDIIEEDLLKVHMKTVTYLRLDGSIPAGSRHNLIERFNNDPSIDLLLLTTHVGGLGLNLTGADTVIFVEHDWNPMRDLQAMDRAHRIGQKKVVNVYRLITKGSLEEKIMNLQKFKLTTANSVISNENSSLLSMGTDQLLDLFNLNTKTSKQSSNVARNSSMLSMKNAIEMLPELWQETQYEEEYNMESFLQTLKK